MVIITAGIPTDAVFFGFCYPLLSTNYMVDLTLDDLVAQIHGYREDLLRHAEMEDPFVCLLVSGGFLYLNEECDIVAINSFCFKQVSDDL